jgi:hypothetical protein
MQQSTSVAVERDCVIEIHQEGISEASATVCPR